MKIAIIKCSSIGDIVHAAYIPREILKFLPDAKIDWYIDTNFAEVILGDINIQNIITIPYKEGVFAINSYCKSLKSKGKLSQDYDIVIDLQGTWKSLILSKKLKCKNLWGFRNVREIGVGQFYPYSSSIKLEENIYTRNITLVNDALGLDILYENVSNSLFMNSEKLDFIPFDKYYVVVSNTSSKKKELSNKFWIDVLSQINEKQEANFVLTYGNEREEENVKEIYFSYPNNVLIFPKSSIYDLKNLIKYSSGIIGCDTGISHMGLGLGIPTIILTTIPNERIIYKNNQFIEYSVLPNPNEVVNKFLNFM